MWKIFCQVLLLSVLGLALALPLPDDAVALPYILPYHAGVYPYAGVPLVYAAPLGNRYTEILIWKVWLDLQKLATTYLNMLSSLTEGKHVFQSQDLSTL